MLDKTSDCFRCRCCNELPEGGMDQNLVDLLNEAGVTEEDITEDNCGYRCKEHNAEVGGETNSQHLYGTAADVSAARFESVEALAQKFEALGADGVGRYPEEEGNFVHVDTRSGRIGDDFRW